MTTDWLDPGLVACPSCSTDLFRVDHSPFYDAWFLYCDRCPRRAEVSFYDQAVLELKDSTLPDRFREIERRLLPCSCGGRYLFLAPRRCTACAAVVLDGHDSVDLWPACYSVPGDRDPNEAETRQVAEFEAIHIQRLNLWQPR